MIMKTKYYFILLLGVSCFISCVDKSELDDLQRQINSVKEEQNKKPSVSVLGQVQALTYIPRYDWGEVPMPYAVSNGRIVPGSAEIDFRVSPSGLAEKLANKWESIMSAEAVYTAATKSRVEIIPLSIDSAFAEGDLLTVVISGAGLKDEFFLGKCSASICLNMKEGDDCRQSGYIHLSSAGNERADIDDDDSVDFPDEALRNYLLSNYDENLDGKISKREAELVVSIECSNLGIQSVSGIEFCSNLKSLNVSNNQIRTIDLRKNNLLQKVYVNDNSLVSLYIGQNSEISVLNCSNNMLSSLNLAEAKKLVSLFCSSNKLLMLDVSNNNDLKYLDVSQNDKIETLDYIDGLTIITGFAVGRYVIVNGCPGICFTNAGEPTKIMALDEIYASWEDGNAWCSSKGNGWRMSDYEELCRIYENRELLNETLLSVYGTQLHPDEYWSSTVQDWGGGPDRIFTLTLYFQYGTNDLRNDNTYPHYVRAVKTM